MIRLTLILGAASFLVHVFAIVTPWWVYRRDDDAKYGPYTGLWQTCTSVGSGEYKKHVCNPIGYGNVLKVLLRFNEEIMSYFLSYCNLTNVSVTNLYTKCNDRYLK